MDTWAWVGAYEGELRAKGATRLAELLRAVPDATWSGDHESVERLTAEALELCGSQNNAWVELFVRHFRLVSRALLRGEVGANVTEARAVHALALTPTRRECPQGICASLDLAACLGQRDGRGHAAERLALTAAAFERVDVTTSCYACLGIERARALLDDGRPDEALGLLDGQRAALAAADEAEIPAALSARRAEVLLALGRAEDALEALDAMGEPGIECQGEIDARPLRARALLGLDRAGEALDLVPSLDEMLAAPLAQGPWQEALTALVDADALPNDWRLGSLLVRLESALARRGAAGQAITAALAAGRLAMARGARAVARACVERAELRLAELAGDEASRDLLRSLVTALARADAERAVEANDDEPRAESEEAVLRALGDDPELALDAVVAARERWPDSELLARQHGAALRACGLEREAAAMLASFVSARPEALQTLRDLGQSLVLRGAHDELESLLASRPPAADDETRATELWLRARSDEARGQFAAARTRLYELCTLAPRAHNARLLLARIERDLGDREAALTLLDALASELEPGEVDWDRMVVATLLGRWTAARQSAARLGLELDGEGPIETDMGLCGLRFTDAQGADEILGARRTGPVTARVVEITGPGVDEHFGDLVVFDPEPLNPRPPEGSESERHVYVYPVLERLEPGGFRSFSFEGAHPGEPALEALGRALDTLGCELQLRSDETYELELPTGPREGPPRRMPGMIAAIAMPPAVAPADLQTLLRRETAPWQHPAVWPELAAALDDREEQTRQLAIAKLYGL